MSSSALSDSLRLLHTRARDILGEAPSSALATPARTPAGAVQWTPPHSPRTSAPASKTLDALLSSLIAAERDSGRAAASVGGGTRATGAAAVDEPRPAHGLLAASSTASSTGRSRSASLLHPADVMSGGASLAGSARSTARVAGLGLDGHADGAHRSTGAPHGIPPRYNGSPFADDAPTALHAGRSDAGAARRASAAGSVAHSAIQSLSPPTAAGATAPSLAPDEIAPLESTAWQQLDTVGETVADVIATLAATAEGVRALAIAAAATAPPSSGGGGGGGGGGGSTPTGSAPAFTAAVARHSSSSASLESASFTLASSVLPRVESVKALLREIHTRRAAERLTALRVAQEVSREGGGGEGGGCEPVLFPIAGASGVPCLDPPSPPSDVSAVRQAARHGG
jgi:hypothetical protein